MPLDHAKATSVSITTPITGRKAEILTPAALACLSALQARFEVTRQARLATRLVRQAEFDAGLMPDFLPETAEVRAADWQIGAIPSDLLDRRVEITGPVDRKMIINALNSGARVFMADFEDASSPTFANLIEGQINLKDRWAGTLGFEDPVTGKSYE